MRVQERHRLQPTELPYVFIASRLGSTQLPSVAAAIAPPAVLIVRGGGNPIPPDRASDSCSYGSRGDGAA